MILAAAAYAEGDTDENDIPLPPPPELVLAFQVEQWGAEAAYGKEIPAQLLRRMGTCLNVYNAFISYVAGSLRAAEWAAANPVKFGIVAKVRELRKQYAPR